MTAAGQAGFLRTGDPKGSFFLGRPWQGLCSPGWHPSPLFSCPWIGFEAFLPQSEGTQLGHVQCSIDSGRRGRWGSRSEATETVREEPTSLHSCSVCPLGPAFYSATQLSPGGGPWMALSRSYPSSCRCPPPSPQSLTLHQAGHRAAATLNSGRETQHRLAN